jgi:predicted transcriptional regulator YdeE
MRCGRWRVRSRGIGPFIERAQKEWLPQSGHKQAKAPDFEVYDEHWNPETGPVDYCIPIALL